MLFEVPLIVLGETLCVCVRLQPMGAAFWPAKTVLVACGFEGVGVKGLPPLKGTKFPVMVPFDQG